MYNMSETLYKTAMMHYTQEPLPIAKAIYISPTRLPDKDDLLTTRISDIFEPCDITEKNAPVHFTDGQTANVHCSGRSLFKGYKLFFPMDDIPELMWKEDSDRFFLIFNVCSAKDEEVVLAFPGRGKYKIWLGNTLICCDWYMSRYEDMCICKLREGDNYFTVQCEINPYYAHGANFALDIYPLQSAFIESNTYSYEKDFLQYNIHNIRNQYSLCYNEFTPLRNWFNELRPRYLKENPGCQTGKGAKGRARQR